MSKYFSSKHTFILLFNYNTEFVKIDIEKLLNLERYR